jgi:hypothetical protein
MRLYSWFGDPRDDLDDLNLFNQEAYPKTMEAALKYFQNYKGGKISTSQHKGNRNREGPQKKQGRRGSSLSSDGAT